MRENFWVYMITNKTHTVLYIGVTNDLERRILEHRNKDNPRSFASLYSAHILVWYEHIPTAREAIAAEKRLKGLARRKKFVLIEQLNPRWKDLSEGWYD
jgi:putative endonuclease